MSIYSRSSLINLSKLVTLNVTADAGYLTGGFLALKSGVRLLKNIGETIAHKAEKKRRSEKYNHRSELDDENQSQSPGL